MVCLRDMEVIAMIDLEANKAIALRLVSNNGTFPGEDTHGG